MTDKQPTDSAEMPTPCPTCKGRGVAYEGSRIQCPSCKGTGTSAALDVDEIERKWLQMCGSCDAGMTTECRCPDEDHRNVISDLVAEVRRLRDAK